MFLPFLRGVPASKSAVKRYLSMLRANLLLYEMSSFESKVNTKFKQLCSIKKHNSAVWKYTQCDLTSLVTLCLSFTFSCKAVESLCMRPSSCLFSPLNISGYLWQLQPLHKKTEVPKVIGFLWTLWGWMLSVETLIVWHCPLLTP